MYKVNKEKTTLQNLEQVKCCYSLIFWNARLFWIYFEYFFLFSRNMKNEYKNEFIRAIEIEFSYASVPRINLIISYSVSTPKKRKFSREKGKKNQKPMQENFAVYRIFFFFFHRGEIHSRHVFFKLSWIISFVYLFWGTQVIQERKNDAQDFFCDPSVTQSCVKNNNCWDKFGLRRAKREKSGNKSSTIKDKEIFVEGRDLWRL